MKLSHTTIVSLRTFFFVLFFTLLYTFLSPSFSFGIDVPQYVALEGLPGVTDTNHGNLAQYFNRIYILIISIGGLIAVVKFIIAGVKYSLSGIVTDKEDAKHDIRGALLGLAILLVPFIVLNEIYPGLTNLNFLANAPKVGLIVSPTPPPSAPVEKTPAQKKADCLAVPGQTWVNNICMPAPGTPIDLSFEFRILQSELANYSNAQMSAMASNCPPGSRMEIKPDPNDSAYSIVYCKRI